MSLIFAWGDLYFISSRAALSVRRDVDQEGNSRTAKTIKLMEVAISDGLHPIDFDEVSAFEVKIWSQAGGLDAVSCSCGPISGV